MYTTALAIGLGMTSRGLAQDAPTFIPVQGSLTGDDGTPRDGTYTLEFRLYAQDAGGSAFYAESQIVMVEAGIFTAYLGDGTPTDLGNGSTSPPLDLATFANRPRGVTFLGITIDEDPEMTPRIQLGSVPFAAFAQTCGDASTIDGKSVAMFATSDASSLTSGTISKDRLPGLSASDIRDGTLAVSRIPDLSNLYARKDHSHVAAPPASHTHDFDELSGSLSSSQLPDHKHRYGDLTGVPGRFAGCYWKRGNCSGTGARENCTLRCDSGDYVVSGGCGVEAGASLRWSYPEYGPDSANNRWSPKEMTGWYCRSSDGRVEDIRIMCCSG